jgi:hypothetical protein
MYWNESVAKMSWLIQRAYRVIEIPVDIGWSQQLSGEHGGDVYVSKDFSTAGWIKASGVSFASGRQTGESL